MTLFLSRGKLLKMVNHIEHSKSEILDIFTFIKKDNFTGRIVFREYESIVEVDLIIINGKAQACRGIDRSNSIQEGQKCIELLTTILKNQNFFIELYEIEQEKIKYDLIEYPNAKISSENFLQIIKQYREERKHIVDETVEAEYETLFTRVLIEKFDLSRELENPINNAKIILSEKLIERTNVAELKELKKIIDKHENGFKKYIISMNHGELTLYCYFSYIIAAIFRKDMKTSYGTEALKMLSDKINSKLTIEIYDIPINTLIDIIGKQKLKDLSKYIGFATEDRSEEIEKIDKNKNKQYSEEKIPELITNCLQKVLERERIPYRNLIVNKERKELRIELYISESTPQSILTLIPFMLIYNCYDTIYSSSSLTDIYLKIGNEEESIHIKYDELPIVRIVGKVTHYLFKNNILPDKIEYKILDQRLIINIEVKKTRYKKEYIERLLKNIYIDIINEIKKYNISIKLKKGIFTKIQIP